MQVVLKYYFEIYIQNNNHFYFYITGIDEYNLIKDRSKNK